MRMGHAAVVLLEVGAVGTLKDTMSKTVDELLLLLLGMSRQHLFGEAQHEQLLLGRWGGAGGGACRGGGGVCWLATHWSIF